MEKSDTLKGVYKPIEELFQTPCYEVSQQCCWFEHPYMLHTAVMAELLRRQEDNRLPSSVSREDIVNLIDKMWQNSQTVWIWTYQLEAFEDPEFLPLLKLYNLVWDVTNSLRKRDIEFEALQLVKTQKTLPPKFGIHSETKILDLADMLSRVLKKQDQQPVNPKQLGPREVVLEVVPKVFQALWLPPECTGINMPSQHLTVLAVSLTKAVEDRVSKRVPSLPCEVTFTRSTRDRLVQSIVDNVTRSFPHSDLMEMISCFALDLMKSIATVATQSICELFQTQIPTKELNTVHEEEKQEPHQESAFTPSPPAPVSPPVETAVVLECTTVEKSEATRGIYKPIEELFQKPVYEMSQQCCWNPVSYRVQTAVMTELLRLQENNQLPSSVSGEDMMNLFEDECKTSLKVQLWQFQLQHYNDPEFLPLLNLVWDVSNSLRKRDIEFQARQFIRSPKTIPSNFSDPRIITLAKKFSSILKTRHQQPLTSKQLGPRDVVLQVVPKVLQAFWLPSEDTGIIMPSQHLCVQAISLTKAVEDKVSKHLPSLSCEVSFSRSTRDKLVQSILDSVTQSYTRPVLMEKTSCFALDLMKSITAITTQSICELF